MNKIYCTYKTQNRDGYFYIGRGKYKAVMTGSYTGSGTFYKEFRALNPAGWKTEIILGPVTLEEAKASEISLVTGKLIENEFCLNLRIMAKGNYDITDAYNRFKKLCPEYHKRLVIQKAYEFRCNWEAVMGRQWENVEVLSFEDSNEILKNAHQPFAAYYMGTL